MDPIDLLNVSGGLTGVVGNVGSGTTTASNRYTGGYFNLLYAGVDATGKDGNGGASCHNFITPTHRFLESAVVICLISYEALWAFRRLTIPNNFKSAPFCETKRRLMIMVLCLIFGIEVGFDLRFISRRFHCAIDNTTWKSCLLFRVMVYALTGPILALLFPVLNTLKLPFEIDMYYIQHNFILIVPLYLVSLSGSYTVESLYDPYWAIFSTAVLILYHYIPLQIIGLKTSVNLNMMLCPAISDPFKGRWWRTITVMHQHLMVPLVGKAFALVTNFLFTISTAGLPVPEIMNDARAAISETTADVIPIPRTNNALSDRDPTTTTTTLPGESSESSSSSTSTGTGGPGSASGGSIINSSNAGLKQRGTLPGGGGGQYHQQQQQQRDINTMLIQRRRSSITGGPVITAQ